MAVEPSVPDYKRTLIHNLEEFKKEFYWCLRNPTKVTQEKIKDFKLGVKNLKYFFSEKIPDEKFIRDLERFDVLINKLPKSLSDIEKNTVELIFERIQKLINDLG
jgi:hypothetical protein